uniref:Uncharacterized protein n=1 Tax=Vitis vinifera TaxID=29760 RepID=F6HZX2_VITVI
MTSKEPFLKTFPNRALVSIPLERDRENPNLHPFRKRSTHFFVKIYERVIRWKIHRSLRLFFID